VAKAKPGKKKPYQWLLKYQPFCLKQWQNQNRTTYLTNNK
jgi:hypothetical protein